MKTRFYPLEYGGTKNEQPPHQASAWGWMFCDLAVYKVSISAGSHRIRSLARSFPVFFTPLHSLSSLYEIWVFVVLFVEVRRSDVSAGVCSAPLHKHGRKQLSLKHNLIGITEPSGPTRWWVARNRCLPKEKYSALEYMWDFFFPPYPKNWGYSAMTGYVAALEPRRVLCFMNSLFYITEEKKKPFTFCPSFFSAPVYLFCSARTFSKRLKVDAGGDSVEETGRKRGARIPLPCRHPRKGGITRIRVDASLVWNRTRCVKIRQKEWGAGGKGWGGLFHQRGKEKEQINGGMIMNYLLATEGVRGER